MGVKLTDFSYVCDPSHGVLYRACRSAVLHSLVKPKSGVETPARIENLLRRWRVRISVLAQAGWPCAQHKRDLQYLRNCPPFGIRVRDDNPAARRCGRTRICPWCYSKKVVATAFRAAERVLYGDMERPDPDLYVFAMRQQWSWDGTAVTPAQVLESAHSARRDDLVGSSVGSFTLQRIEPIDERIRLSRSTLMIVSKSGKPGTKPAPPESADVRCLTDVKKKSLADLVGWTCRYPTGLMYGDTRLTLAILAEAKRRRFHSHFRTGAMYWDEAKQETS